MTAKNVITIIDYSIIITLPILSSFGLYVLEIFDQCFFGFGKIGVLYKKMLLIVLD